MKDSVSRLLLRQAALNHGYTVSKAGDDEYFLEVTHPSGKTVLFRGTLNSRNSATGSLIARRKELTLDFMQTHGVQVPPYTSSIEQAASFLKEHGTIVVKPSDAAQSRGVTVNVTTMDTLAAAIREAQSFSRSGKIILQKQISGKLYRLLVVNGSLVAVAHRKAAEVMGDGTSTVEELIAVANTDPRRSDDPDTPLKTISTKAAREFLGEKVWTAVPAPGEVVIVSELDSVSAGGEAIDVTDEVHADHKRMAEKISNDLDLYVCGIDIICDDIAAPANNGYWPLLEINSGPGLKIHHYPTGGGQPRDVASLIMDGLFGTQT